MPFNYDFSKLENVKEMLVHPKGWTNPLIIEYGIGYHKENLSYFWRVKGTKHTFVIPVIRLDYISEGDYKSHFEEVLESFREDYKQWAAQNWETDWMKEYKKDFNNFIYI